MDEQVFDRLIGDFYRAATGVRTWDEVLESLRQELEVSYTWLEIYDVPTRSLLSLQGAGQRREPASLDYVRQWHLVNPRIPPMLGVPARQWMHCHDYFDPEFVARDPFYRDFAPAYDSRFASGMRIELDERTVAVVGLHRPHRSGPLLAEDPETLARIGAHLSDALVAHQRVRRIASQALAGHVLLSGFPYPMWLLDADRHVFFANPAAAAEQLRGAPVELRGSRLGLHGSRLDQAFTERLTVLAQAAHGSTTVLALASDAAEAPRWLHLSTLVPGQTLGAFGEQPQMLATLFDPEQVSELDPYAIAKVFQLSPAESKVATRIAQGLSPNEIAAEHGTRISTVRTQLSRVLAKLGVERQADVVRVLRQGEALWARKAL